MNEVKTNASDALRLGPNPPQKNNRILHAAVLVLCIVCALLIAAVSVLFALTVKLKGAVSTPDSPLSDEAAAKLIRPGITEVLGDVDKSGSGVAVQYGGEQYIMTNYHVIINNALLGSSVKVRYFGTNDFVEAQILGYDSFHDIALLRAEKTSPYAASMTVKADGQVAQGQPVFTSGNDLGKGVSVYRGNLTNPYQMLRTMVLPESSDKKAKAVPVYQTSAAVNVGMSGGGMFDAYGNLIGIVTYHTADVEDNNTAVPVTGVGYAVPASIFSAVCKEILASGKGGQIEKLSVEGDSENMSDPEFGFNPRINLTSLKLSGSWKGEGFTMETGTSAGVSDPILEGDILVKIGATPIGALPDYAPLFAALLNYKANESAGEERLNVTVKRGEQLKQITFDNIYLKHYF